jgi:hypothetical protein
MSSFGASSSKPMVLFSNAPWIADILQHARPSGPTQRLAVLSPDGTTGELRPRGGVALQESQAYNYEFGESLASVFSARRKEWRKQRPSRVCQCVVCPDAYSIIASPIMRDAWPDAELQGILTAVKAQARTVAADVLMESAIIVD